MGVDVVYDMLQPFHVWAQVAAMCALVLAIAAWVLLSLSSRGSRRWWLGLNFFVLCLAPVAFGERSRMAADRRSMAACLKDQVAGCEVWRPWLRDAVARVNVLGLIAVVVAALGLIATLATLYAERKARVFAARAMLLLLGMAVAGAGTFLITDGIAS
jgi:hypothetical protein